MILAERRLRDQQEAVRDYYANFEGVNGAAWEEKYSALNAVLVPHCCEVFPEFDDD